MSRISALRLAALLAACLLLLVGSALAASPLVEIKDLKQPVAAGSITTYADLLKLVFPEPPAGEKEAPETPPVRSLSDYFKAQPLTAKQGYGDVLALPIKDRGRPLLLLLVSATGERVGEEGDAEEQHFELLALFQTAPAPKLLDLVDIGQGMTMGMIEGFWCKNPLLNLTPATQACMVFQEHFNSSQSYLQIHLLWVRNQRLEELLGVFAFGGKGLCESFATKAVFRTLPDKGREYPKVVARLTVTMEPSPKDEECDKQRQRGFTRSYQGTWRWDPAKQKYRQVSGDLDKLYKWYEKYY
ncbi:MAG: hypothetical protein NTY36_08320 [Deltaproteobacteria bacterium]|nr:hypothetical protein [Deltaproteobacteria bacterium]